MHPRPRRKRVGDSKGLVFLLKEDLPSKIIRHSKSTTEFSGTKSGVDGQGRVGRSGRRRRARKKGTVEVDGRLES